MNWKKEIRLFDRGDRQRPEPPADSTPKTPLLKREVAFRRKRADAPVAQPAESERVSIWKREVTIGRRKPGVERVAPAHPPVEDAPVAAGADPDVQTAPPGDDAALVAALVPEAELPLAPAATEGYGWLTEPLDGTGDDPSWVDLVGPPRIPSAAPAVEPEDLEQAPAPESSAPVAPSPEPVPAPLPGIHPPVPASALPPLPGTPGRRSLLKREISFGRKPKVAAVPQPEDGGDEEAPARDRSPFWRRELSPRRRPTSKAAAPVESSPRPARRAKREKGAQRHKNLVGLKVGASQIAAARLSNGGSTQVLQLARQELEPGIVSGGELRDPDALAEALKAFFKQNKLPKRSVRLGIATNRIGVRTVEIAGIDDPKQLANAVRFRAQEMLPIAVDDAVLDYRVLRERTGEDGERQRDILVVVAYRDLVERYMDACRKAGIRLVGIDLEAFALLRAVGETAHQSTGAATVVVSIGYDRSTFAVSDGSVCEFTRVIDWGGATIDVAVARVLNMAPSEVEGVKRTLSLAGDGEATGLTPQQVSAARDAVRAQIASFARELVSSLQFYQSQPGSLSIGSIALTGGTSHLAGLADELSRLVGVDVRVANPLANLKVAKKVAAPDQVGSLAVAIGLGIES